MEQDPPTRRPLPALLVLMLAVVLAFGAWPFFDLLEGGGPFGVPDDLLWPAFWAVSFVALAGLVVAAMRGRPTLAASLRLSMAAGVGYVGGLVIALFVFMSLWDGCGLQPESATWSDPALYAALDAPAVLQLPPGGRGIPLQAADLDARWGNWSLQQVAWTPADVPAMSVQADGSAVQVVAVHENATTFRESPDVARFLEGFQRPGGPGLDAFVARMLANETVSQTWSRPRPGDPWGNLSEFRALLPPGWTPQPAWDATAGITNASIPDGRSLGRVSVAANGWTFDFAIPAKQLDGDGFSLRVDAEGTSSFEGLGAGSESAYRKRVQRELERVGLPAPAGKQMDVQGSIC